MVTALYRRYRPENFAEMIGQSQVTDPLMTALRTNRVNHAYLFSGPRGCGKTTSARILARCLNCAEGPTDSPCGVCPSCVELSRDGSGSLDVVEIDAASHGGVDDARDLRERAIFAPARDRYKIFIIDEAHMVTSGGFNALLKIVEEPPEHVKFIFATTEPDKVIGTIRSRTHHYPFRLIPPAQLLEYVQQLCDSEGVEVAPGVLPLVVRAGGGSARDTLSLLDQLIAGSEGNRVEYERAVALLGYTHGALLSEAIDALGTHDGAAAFDAVDRVIQTGQDPRRFVEDLLERLRDIIVVEATREQASSVLRGVPADEIEVMRRQATLFGHAELSRVADIVNTALSEMTGATSPRLHLELMVARTLVPSVDDTQRGALARVERLERRIGVDGGGAPAGAVVAGATEVGAPVAAAHATVAPAAVVAAPAPSASTSSIPSPSPAPAASSGGWAVAAPGSGAPSSREPEPATATDPGKARERSEPVPASPRASEHSAPSASPVNTPDVVATPPSAAPLATPVEPGTVSVQQLKDAWPEILDRVQKAKMTAWLVVYTAQVRSLDGDVLTLAFPSENDVASFKERSAPGQGVSEYLREAIVEVLGLRVKYIARVDTSLRPHDAPDGGGTAGDAAPVAGASTPSAPAPAAASVAPSADSVPSTPPTPAPVAPPTNDPRAGTPAGGGSDLSPSTAAADPQPAATPNPTGIAGMTIPPRRTPAPVPASEWSTPGVSDLGGSSFEEPAPPSPPAAAPESPAAAASGSTPPVTAQDGQPAEGAHPADPEPAGQQPVQGQRPAQADPAGQQPVQGQRPAQADPAGEPPAQGQRPAQADAAGRQPTQGQRPAQAQATGQGQGQGQRPAQQRPAPQRAPEPQRGPASADGSAPTTSWDVVAIPTSAGSDDDEPPFFDEPMPSDEPDLPADRAGATPDPYARATPSTPIRPSAAGGTSFGSGSGRGGAEANRPGAPAPASGASSAPAPASPASGPNERRPGALRFEPSPEADTAPATPAHVATTASGRARYGEAVVREILGANFIEEQPLPSREPRSPGEG
ncbi:DNA polymerase III subunit gamma and tau [Herbiconiux sp. A18JL235]|uniref:DNA-directed DNA polymerase n=1 Tax=Herbiconiux sp. A18JL235 TaxID=3152363 RepID=A0AB39BJ15_9MICO